MPYSSLSIAERYFIPFSNFTTFNSAGRTNTVAIPTSDIPNTNASFSDFSTTETGQGKVIFKNKELLIVIAILVGGVILYYYIDQQYKRRRQIDTDKDKYL